MWGEEATICAVASMPLTRGMCRSISTTSGWRSRASAIAIAPSEAVPTTSTSGVAASRASSPRRNSSWSSAINTRWPSIGSSLLCSCWSLVERQPHLDHGAATGAVPRLERPAELLGAFPHRGQAYTRAPVRSQPRSRVGDVDAQLAVLARQAYDAPVGAAVALHVGDGLDDDAVGRDLYRGGERLDVVTGLHRPRHPGTGGPVLGGPVAQRRDQAELVQRGWSQPLHQSSYLADALAGLVGEPRDQVRRLLGVVVDEVGGRLEAHRERRERGAEAVVQVAPEPPPLLLPRRDQPLPRDLELTVGGDRLHEGADLGPHVLEQPTVPRPERVVAGVDLDPEVSDRGAADGEVDGRGRARRSPDGGGDRSGGRRGQHVDGG